MTNPILWPTLALAALIFAVCFTLMTQRLRHVQNNPPTAADFADGEFVQRYFRTVERPAHNLANLFEMPVLFFSLVPLLIITGHAHTLQLVLAWLFVVLRLLHSLIHIGPNKIRARFRAYLASCAVLLVMWIVWTLDLAGLAPWTHGS